MSGTLGRTFDNVTSVYAVFSSFQIDNTIDFGFDSIISNYVSPLSTVSMTVSQTLTTHFTVLGSCFLVVSRPFDQIMLFSEFNIVNSGQTYTNSFTMPASYSWDTYVTCIKMSTSTTGYYAPTKNGIYFVPSPTGFSITFTFVKFSI